LRAATALIGSSIVALSLAATSCSRQRAVAPPAARTALTYEIVKEHVDDTFIKTEVYLKVVVSGNVTEAGLRQLLDELYSKVAARTGFRYHSRPNSIFVYAYASNEHAASGPFMGAIMKSASETQPSVMIDEQQIAEWGKPPETKFGLSEDQRRRIWTETIRAEDRAAKEAEERYPEPDPLGPSYSQAAAWEQLDKQLDVEERLSKEYKAGVARKHGITDAQLREIGIEGSTKSWPFPPSDG